ncbi:MAG: hypothetical protein WAV22_14270, partial [Porticoccaceae bacterium]
MNQGEEKKPIIEQLDAEITRGQKILAKGDIRRGMLQMWMSPVRAKIRRIYGDSAEVKAFFPETPAGLSPAHHA